MIEAMRAAFVDFIGRLDPRDLATRFERSARRKTMGNWELYGDFYRSLCEMQPGTLPHIFRRDLRAQLRTESSRRGRQLAVHRRRLSVGSYATAVSGGL
jgi:predicted component of type VI protein secretion system